MAKYRSGNKTLLAALEDTYGVDQVPTGALNAIQTKNFEMNPLEGEALQRELDKGTFGSDPGTLIGQHVTISFEIEIAGAGTAGDIPAYDAVIQAAGHAQDSDDPGGAPTEIYYDPIDEDVPSCTFYGNMGGVLHKIVGARGSLVMSWSKRQYGYMRFEFMGLDLEKSGAALPTTDYSGFITPIPFRAANIDFSLFGNTTPLHTLEITGGQSISFYENSVEETLEQEDRESTFSATIEHPDLSVWDVFEDIRNDVVGALQLVHGTVGGNIFQVDCGEVQLSNSPSHGNETGIVSLSVGGPVIVSSTTATAGGYRITVK